MTKGTFLTFDIEEWYHANYPGCSETRHIEATNLPSLVDRLIEICARHEVHTTCFVLGMVADRYPSVVKRLHAAGHEIASHGYGHEALSSLSKAQFAADLKRSVDSLEQLTGAPVLGYRAPSFSVKRESLEDYYAVLEEAGLRYSSSVFPGATFLYGVPGFPDLIHRPMLSGGPTSVLEFPVPLVRFAGIQMGLYLRFFPAFVIRRIISSRAHNGRATVLYLHPREIDTSQPRLDLPRHLSLIHYWGIAGCEQKLNRLLAGERGGMLRMRDLIDAPEYSA